MDKIRNLIVGCGLSGAVLARRIAEEKNEKVLIVDRRDHSAGIGQSQEQCAFYLD